MKNPFHSLWSWLRRVVETVETQPWGAGTILGLLAAIVAVRNLLELRVAGNPVFEGLAAFVHYPLAYVAPFFALTLALAVWSRTAPGRVARLMTLAWLLTLLPPLADLLLHRGAEKPTIAYLQADPSELLQVWVRFFDPRVTLTGTTAGIRIEALLAVILGAVYVLLKTGRLWRAVGAGATIYATSLFFFSLPLIVVRAFRLINPKLILNDVLRGESILLRGTSETAPDSAGILWLVPVIALLALLWVWAERRRPSEALLPHPLGVARLPGAGPVYAGSLLAGAMAAVWLHLPVAQPLVYAPYDFLAFFGAPAAMLLLASAARRLAPGDGAAAVWLGGAGLVICGALGRSASVGLIAAAATLAPFGLDVVPDRWRSAVGAITFPLGAFAAFAGGYGLVIGPEGLARIPAPSAALTVCAALGFGAIAGVEFLSPSWAAIPALGAALGLGAILTGEPRLLVVAVPAGVAAALAGWGVERIAGRTAGRRALGIALALAALGLVRGVLATDSLREPWATSATCVSRLDVVRGERFESRGDWPAAENAFRKALQCDPDYVPALRGLGLGLFKHDPNRRPKGVSFLERAAELAPGSPVELNNVASAYLQLKRPDEALALLDKARALEPSNLGVAFNRAQALEDVGRRQEATDAWAAYLEAARRRPEEAESVRLARQHLRALRGQAADSPPPSP